MNDEELKELARILQLLRELENQLWGFWHTKLLERQEEIHRCSIAKAKENEN